MLKKTYKIFCLFKDAILMAIPAQFFLILLRVLGLMSEDTVRMTTIYVWIWCTVIMAAMVLRGEICGE